MQFATYHQEHGAKKLAVVKEHEDGTVDLALTPGGEPAVTRCPVSQRPQPGHCTLFEEPAPEKSEKSHKHEKSK